MLPKEGVGRKHVYHLYVVRVPKGKRDALRDHLAADGITSMVHYPRAVHRQPACKPFVRVKIKFDFTDQLSKEILSLPIFPEMMPAEVERVCEVIKQFYA